MDARTDCQAAALVVGLRVPDSVAAGHVRGVLAEERAAAVIANAQRRLGQG